MSGDQYGDRTTSGDIVTHGTKIFGSSGIPSGPPVASSSPTTAPDAVPEGNQPDADVSRNVFVVHGRDDQVRAAMFELLRRLDLHPLEWGDLVRATGEATPYLGQVVTNAPAQARAALVLLTPDDIVRLHPALHGDYEPYFEAREVCQPRPNALLELGMVLMAYPERTLVVEVGQLRPIADINGLNVIRFDGSAAAVRGIVQRLETAGCKVNDAGTDWLDLRSFAALAAYTRTPPMTA